MHYVDIYKTVEATPEDIGHRLLASIIWNGKEIEVRGNKKAIGFLLEEGIEDGSISPSKCIYPAEGLVFLHTLSFNLNGAEIFASKVIEINDANNLFDDGKYVGLCHHADLPEKTSTGFFTGNQEDLTKQLDSAIDQFKTFHKTLPTTIVIHPDCLLQVRYAFSELKLMLEVWAEENMGGPKDEFALVHFSPNGGGGEEDDDVYASQSILINKIAA